MVLDRLRASTGCLFEVMSAFATVGLSTGITAGPAPGGPGDPDRPDVRRPPRARSRSPPRSRCANAPPLRTPQGEAHHWLTARIFPRRTGDRPTRVGPGGRRSSSSGSGRFGSALAPGARETRRPRCWASTATKTLVQAHNGRLTHVVRADSTNEEALRQLAVPEFDRVVVGIGTDIEASILTASLLVKFGGPEHLGQGHQRAAREDPHPARRAPRDPAPRHDMGSAWPTSCAARCSTTSSSRTTSS